MPPSWIGPEVTLAPTPRGKDVAIAQAFGIALAAARDPASWQLVRAQDRMQLCTPAGPGQLTIEIGLSHGPMARRLRNTSRDEPLPRACGLPRKPDGIRVVDATAGLCRDAMVLASLGCQVTAIERVPALAFLAQSAIESSWLAPNLRVQLGDAIAVLAALPPASQPEVVCLDPMFDEPGPAQVKKDMQICRLLAGPPDHHGALFAAAMAAARDRVVVKRDVKAPPLVASPSFTVAGERVRFDVYLVKAQTAGSQRP